MARSPSMIPLAQNRGVIPPEVPAGVFCPAGLGREPYLAVGLSAEPILQNEQDRGMPARDTGRHPLGHSSGLRLSASGPARCCQPAKLDLQSELRCVVGDRRGITGVG